jgi:hypothetical protein
MQVLAKNKSIITLYAIDNNVGTGGAKALANNTTLRKLYLNKNNIIQYQYLMQFHIQQRFI